MDLSAFWKRSAVLTIAWLGLAGFLLLLNVGWYFWVFVTVSFLAMILMTYQRYFHAQKKKLDAIKKFSRDVWQKSYSHSFEPFSAGELPDEVKALATTVNELYRLQQDREEQEHAFFSVASHELRTPLTGIRLQAQLAQRAEDPQKRKKALDNIIIGIDKSTVLVEQLLTYSRLTQRFHNNQLMSIDIRKIFDLLLSYYKELALANSVQLYISIASDLPMALSTEYYVQTVVVNLMDNALRYTPAGGIVKVSVQKNNSDVQIKIEDSGPGIAEDQYGVVRAPFQKLLSGHKNGCGLGLSIVNRIAEIHGNALNLQPSELGGLAVIFNLPSASN